MSDLTKENEWRQIIETCKASGMPIKYWCHANNVSLNQYHYWKRKFNATPLPVQDAQWAPLIVGDHSDSKSSSLPVVLQINSYKIELRKGFDLSVLSDVLKVIQSLC